MTETERERLLQEEREACAALCDAHRENYLSAVPACGHEQARRAEIAADACRILAREIRARGQS